MRPILSLVGAISVPIGAIACGASAPKIAPGGGAATNAASTSAASATDGAPPCTSGMVAVAAGSFARAGDGQKVTVGAHCLDLTEVTLGAYDACVKSGKCTEPEPMGEGQKKACNWKRPEATADQPINCVTWAQAGAYCASLGARLPSENEWEWSARGGSAGTEYPWGNAPPTGRACYDDEALEDSPDFTCKVGSFPKGANPQGVLDLTGNVWEWTSSNWKDGKEAVDRGGGWLNADLTMLAIGLRNHLPKTASYPSLGFRCAK
jgi:formylglycine-generating enzyme required for sulfatase activity